MHKKEQRKQDKVIPIVKLLIFILEQKEKLVTVYETLIKSKEEGIYDPNTLSNQVREALNKKMKNEK